VLQSLYWFVFVQVIAGVGLAIAVWDVSSLGDPIVFMGEGVAHLDVKFRCV